jgi:cytoskeletal protein CcmA (bactofilin family)
MFGKSKDDNDQPSNEIQQPTKTSQLPPADLISTISRNMTVVGKITDEGTVHVFGQIEGELWASTVLIDEGAKVEGDLVAKEVTIGGMVKGSIHANRVKLNGTAIVEGDIFHRSLSIEENARFEGLSKREDNAVDAPRTLPEQSTTHDESETKASAIQGNWKPNGASGHSESPSVGAS